MSSYYINIKHNKAREQWDLRMSCFHVQEINELKLWKRILITMIEYLLRLPNYNCATIHNLFPRLQKGRINRYRITVEDLNG